MKRPSLQFYVGDWQSNTNLRRCTFAEKGIWLEAMCLMHDAEEYGVLRWPLKEIAQAIGCKISELLALKAKGVLKGADAGERCPAHVYTPRHAGKDGEPVTLIPDQEGPIWFSSRMVNDEYVRNSRGKGTRFGEKTKPPKEDDGSQPTRRMGDWQGDEPSQREGDGPSTSSSSSLSVSKKDPVVDSTLVESIFKWLQVFLNSPAPLFTAPIAAWLAWGADFELDIKPVAERWRQANPKKTIRSLEWLDEDIAASIRKRSKPMPEEQSNPKGDAHADRTKSSSANRSSSAGGGGINKADRAKAAVLRAAIAGGYAPEAGHEGEAGAGGNVVPMLPGAEGLG